MDILTALKEKSLNLSIVSGDTGRIMIWNGSRWEVSGVEGRKEGTTTHLGPDSAIHVLTHYTT